MMGIQRLPVDDELFYAENKKAATEYLKRIQGTYIRNLSDGTTARISSTSIGKLLSNKALSKSLDNGFSIPEHDTAAANIARLFREAVCMVTRPDRKGSPDIVAIHIYQVRIQFKEKAGIAEILLKESRQDGHLIYTVELMKIKEKTYEKDKSPTASVEGSESQPARPEDSSIIMLPVS